MIDQSMFVHPVTPPEELPPRPLNDYTVRSMAIARKFTEHSEPINSLTFSDDGELLVSAADDDTLLVYDCMRGSTERSLKCNKYGVKLLSFLHTKCNMIHAARQEDYSIRHFSLHDNKYIRYYKGHKKPVTALKVSPNDDMFMSCGMDGRLRFYDVREPSCMGEMKFPTRPNAAFDPEGLVVAATLGSEEIRLYDKRSFESGAFATFNLSGVNDREWVDIEFCNDGKSLMVIPFGSHLRLVDAFNGSLTHTLTGFINDTTAQPCACFTPNSRYVVCGGTDGRVTFWNRDTGIIMHSLDADEGRHPPPLRLIRFSPVYHMMATGARRVRIWSPSEDPYL